MPSLWTPLILPLTFLGLAVAQTERPMSSSTKVLLPSSSLSSTSITRSTTSTPSALSATQQTQIHTIKVGAGGFSFQPSNLPNIPVGDVITFEFYPPDHSVARADFESPCLPYEYLGKNRTGIFSGVQNVATTNDLTHYNVTVNSTDPIFYYCTAKGSCLNQQMIGVINPNSTQTLALQLEALKTATLMVVPGDPMPKEESTPSGSSPSPSASSTSQANVDAQHNIKWRLSKEDIIGIVVGIILLIAICAALFYFVGRARSLKQGLRTKDAAVIKTSAGPDHGPDYTGIPGSPYSPNVHHADFGGGNGYHPPGYQDGWTSPGLQTPHLSIAEQHRMSMMSMMSTTPVPEKYNYVGVRPNPSQDMIAEMGGSEPVEMEGTVVSKSPPPPALHH